MSVNYIRGLILNLILLALAFAKGTTPEVKNIPLSSSNLVFQVVQSTFALDKTTVANANIENLDGSFGLHLYLKPQAEKKWRNISGHNIGRHMNIVLNGKVISMPILESEMGGELLISGLTNQQATDFIQSLNS
jgi:preprotein translocase subunit SecD